MTRIYDGERTVEIRAFEMNQTKTCYSYDLSAKLLCDSTIVYDRIMDAYKVESVADVINYFQEWENEDPENRYFDYGEV